MLANEILSRDNKSDTKAKAIKTTKVFLLFLADDVHFQVEQALKY